jgi:hypothetical protein
MLVTIVGRSRRVRKPRILAGVAAAWLLTQPAGAGESARDVLRRVRAYLQDYDRQLVSVVADEHYAQTGDVGPEPVAPRMLDSEFAWIAIPELHDVIGVREVRAVDGQPVSTAPRLRTLLEHPSMDPLSEVQAILAESARHNIGVVERNINFPTFALAYLRPPDREGMRWRLQRATRTLELTFDEHGPATLIRAPSGSRARARGQFLVEARSGRILQSQVRVRLPERESSSGEYLLQVDFAQEPRLGLWVPVRMIERWTTVEGTATVPPSGEATYSNYRRYVTSGRLVK